MGEDQWDVTEANQELVQEIHILYGRFQQIEARLRRLASALRTTTFRDSWPALQHELQTLVTESSYLEQEMGELLRSL